jgi:hypothetical protein
MVMKCLPKNKDWSASETNAVKAENSSWRASFEGAQAEHYDLS